MTLSKAALKCLMLATVLLGLGAAPAATAAPVLEVEVTRDEAIVTKTDERVDYTVTVANSASTSPAVGDAVSCTNGSWNGSPTFSYQWIRNGIELDSAQDIANGSQTQSYQLQPGDAGKVVQCLVTGTNATASSLQASNRPTVVGPVPAVAPPSGTARPVITPSSALTPGGDGTCTQPAGWTGTGVTWSLQWLVNGDPVSGPAAGPTSTYTVQASDAGKVLQCQATAEDVNGAKALILSTNKPIQVTGHPSNTTVLPGVAFSNSTSGSVTVELELPAGSGTYADSVAAVGWACEQLAPSGSLPAKVVCSRSTALLPQTSFPAITVIAGLGGNGDFGVARATVTGGGASPVSAADEFEFAPAVLFGFAKFETGLFDELGTDATQAGGHPFTGEAHIVPTMKRTMRPPASSFGGENAKKNPIEELQRLFTDLPRGLVGSAVAASELCEGSPSVFQCPPGSVVGGLDIGIDGGGTQSAIWQMKPSRGQAAAFAFTDLLGTIYTVSARLRADDGYAITLDAAASPALGVRYIDAYLCAYGGKINPGGTFAGCKAKSDPDAFSKPLFTNIPRCDGSEPAVELRASSWQNPARVATATWSTPPITGCDLVPFEPEVVLGPTSNRADSAGGLEAELSVPSDGLESPDGIAQAHLRKTVVELPAGVSVNPSAATGLEGCSDAQLGLGTNDPVSCPDGSKLGTVEVTTPVLEETLTGEMVLRTPRSTDPMSGEMLRMALIVRNDERGLLVKLPGSATADPQTGRITATFDENPQLPIGTVKVDLKGGERGVLAMPQRCGPIATRSTLTSWNDLNAPVSSDTPLEVGGDCGFGFAPVLQAGMDTAAARTNGKLSFRFSRRDGEQWLRGLTAKLPKGLLASVKDLPLCGNAQANAGACPAASKIGTVDAKAGSGDPFVLEQKGEVFLTEGYKGGAYGLAVKVRPVAGPFRDQFELSPIVVRQAIHVDRQSAQVTAVSDPFPLIHHGVPLRVREVTVLVDRERFMLNPSGCDAKQVGADLLSAEGATAGASNAFQAAGCSRLAFKPRLGLRLTGRRQVRTGKHPGIRALVRQNGVPEAGIQKAEVRLPKSLALDVDNAQALCEFDAGTKPDLESHCPKGSIVGRARASSPLLNRPLVGNVYFVKNIRKDPKTGNEIRTLPMIIVALRGEIAINLKGESNTTKSGKLVNTFDQVPDAPVSQFNLNIQGGSNGILAVTRTRRGLINLCARPKSHIAEADMDGQNGRRHDFDVRMKTPCTKRQTRAAKRAAAKRPAARAGSKRR